MSAPVLASKKENGCEVVNCNYYHQDNWEGSPPQLAGSVRDEHNMCSYDGFDYGGHNFVHTLMFLSLLMCVGSAGLDII